MTNATHNTPLTPTPAPTRGEARRASLLTNDHGYCPARQLASLVRRAAAHIEADGYIPLTDAEAEAIETLAQALAGKGNFALASVLDTIADAARA